MTKIGYGFLFLTTFVLGVLGGFCVWSPYAAASTFIAIVSAIALVGIISYLMSA